MYFLQNIRSAFRFWTSSRVFLKFLLTRGYNFFNISSRSNSSSKCLPLERLHLWARGMNGGAWRGVAGRVLLSTDVALGGGSFLHQASHCQTWPGAKRCGDRLHVNIAWPHTLPEVTEWCTSPPSVQEQAGSREKSLAIEKSVPGTCWLNCWVVCYFRQTKEYCHRLSPRIGTGTIESSWFQQPYFTDQLHWNGKRIIQPKILDTINPFMLSVTTYKNCRLGAIVFVAKECEAPCFWILLVLLSHYFPNLAPSQSPVLNNSICFSE